MKIILYLLFITLFVQVFSSPFERPYIGLKGSYGYLKSSTNDSIEKYQYHSGSDKYSIGLLGGYGLQFFKNYYIGLQSNLFFENSCIKQSRNEISFKDGYKIPSPQYLKTYLKNTIDLLLQLGFLPNPKNLLYIFVGPSASLFKIKSEASFYINTPPYITFFFQDTYKFWKFGGKIGLGLAHAFSEHWIGRIETSLIIFGQGNTKTLSFRTTPSTKRQISIKPQLLDVSFSLSYGF